MANICVDLDGVLIALKVVEIASNNNFNETDISDYSFDCLTEDLRQRVYQLFNDEKVMCENIKILDGVVDTLERWKNLGHDIHIVTARGVVIRKKTVDMCRLAFPMVDSINFVDMWQDKNAVLRDLECDLFIDDAPHNVLASKKEFLTILVSNKYTKYNHHLLDQFPNVKAIKDIDEVFLKIGDIAKKIKDLK